MNYRSHRFKYWEHTLHSPFTRIRLHRSIRKFFPCWFETHASGQRISVFLVFKSSCFATFVNFYIPQALLIHLRGWWSILLDIFNLLYTIIYNKLDDGIKYFYMTDYSQCRLATLSICRV